jgi:hypothetical protein
VKSAIESRGKRRIFFIEVDEVRRTGGVHVMATLPQLLRRGRLRELLAGEYEGHVSTFVAKRHAFGERALSGDPAGVYAARFIDPGANDVEILVPQGLHHLQKLGFRALARHLRDESNDSGHIFP